jgi:hypothetical protein
MIQDSSEEEVLQFAMRLAGGISSADDEESKTCTLAVQGLFGTWLDLLDEEAEGMAG